MISSLSPSSHLLMDSSASSSTSSSSDHAQPSDWSAAENKIFENALAVFDPAAADCWDLLSQQLPRKTIDQIKRHYDCLIDDLNFIDAGNVPVPDYAESDRRPARKQKREQERRKGMPWTEDEHRKFLLGLEAYGKGDWRSISRHYVVTRTPTQVASHAQKYFNRLNAPRTKERRRPSIHDIRTVAPEPALATFTPFFNGVLSTSDYLSSPLQSPTILGGGLDWYRPPRGAGNFSGNGLSTAMSGVALTGYGQAHLHGAGMWGQR